MLNDHLANRVLPETKEAIIQEFQRGNASKAALARKYNISSSSVSRILAGADVPTTSPFGNPEKKRPTSGKVLDPHSAETGGSSEDTLLPGTPEKVLAQLSGFLKEIGDVGDLEILVSEFGNWLRSRDELEKEKLKAAMELESLRAEKASVEDRIIRLGSKAASLEMIIGRMKTSAENAQVSVSLVEERLTNIEERLATNRDLLMIAAGVRSIMEHGDIDDETLSFIEDFDDLWKPDTDEMRRRVRKALIHYIEVANSKVRNLRTEH